MEGLERLFCRVRFSNVRSVSFALLGQEHLTRQHDPGNLGHDTAVCTFVVY